MRIATETLDAIAAETAAAVGWEICGLLLGKGDHVLSHTPARNVAADPVRTFEIDPSALLRAHRDQRHGGPAILGCYHSHPSGSPEPSARDAEDAEPNGWLWLIATGDKVRLWRAVPNGAVHGRFDPVPFTCVILPDSPENLTQPGKPSR